MQGKDGGWGAFDVDNDVRILNELPFSDLEATIRPKYSRYYRQEVLVPGDPRPDAVTSYRLRQ